jgi:hypothetical protein
MNENNFSDEFQRCLKNIIFLWHKNIEDALSEKNVEDLIKYTSLLNVYLNCQKTIGGV